VCGWQVKLCDPLVTHGPYLSALEIGIIKHYINKPSFILTTTSSSIDLVFKLKAFSYPKILKQLSRSKVKVKRH